MIHGNLLEGKPTQNDSESGAGVGSKKVQILGNQADAE
jgi:hypothetical protein